MSFEGHYDGLCENGHQCHFPVMYGGEEEQFKNFLCSAKLRGDSCGAKLGFLVLVDDTNCDAYGTHHYIQLTPAETVRCNLNCDHVVNDATFKFSDEEYIWDYGPDQKWVQVGNNPVPRYQNRI